VSRRDRSSGSLRADHRMSHCQPPVVDWCFRLTTKGYAEIDRRRSDFDQSTADAYHDRSPVGRDLDLERVRLGGTACRTPRPTGPAQDQRVRLPTDEAERLALVVDLAVPERKRRHLPDAATHPALGRRLVVARRKPRGVGQKAARSARRLDQAIPPVDPHPDAADEPTNKRGFEDVLVLVERREIRLEVAHKIVRLKSDTRPRRECGTPARARRDAGLERGGRFRAAPPCRSYGPSAIAAMSSPSGVSPLSSQNMIPPRRFWRAYSAFAAMIGGSSNVQNAVPS
jgi:hypothetical protein